MPAAKVEVSFTVLGRDTAAEAKLEVSVTGFEKLMVKQRLSKYR